MPGSPPPVRIEGTIRFPAAVLAPCTARISVRLEDTSRADALAVTLAEQRMAPLEVRGGCEVPFVLHAPALRPRTRYTVRVHADCDGDGRISRGDYVSAQSHPVVPGAAEVRLEIPLVRVD